MAENALENLFKKKKLYSFSLSEIIELNEFIFS